MKISKKLIAVFLAIMLVATTLPLTSFSVFAAENNATIITVENSSAKPGAIVDVNISIKNNPGVLGATLSVTNDNGLTLVDAKSGTAFEELSFAKPGSFSSNNTFTWDGESIDPDNAKDGVILTLSYKISDYAASGSAFVIDVNYDYGDVIDANLEPISLDVNAGKVTVIDYTPGDVNEDGKINTTDCVFIRRYITGGYTLNVFNEDAADVNADGKINTTDIVLLRRYIVGGYGVVLKPAADKHEHVMEAIERREPTCTAEGNIAYWHCTDCDKYFTDAKGVKNTTLENTVIPATGHSPVTDVAVEPTYTSTGLTEGSHCSVCGTIIKAQTEIPKLQRNEYSITYHIDNNDNYLKQQSITNNNPTSYTSEEGLVLQDLMVDGYSFKGWYTSQIGGSKVTDLPAGTSGNKVLYAQWEKVEYTITFDSPDVPVNSVTYTVDRGITLTSPSWFGYTFVGWSLDGEIVSIIPPGTTGNLTLHANWTSNRNQAKAVSKLADPSIIEDMDNGQYLFVYEIGTIENVPLAQIEYIGNSQGININREYEYTKSVGEGFADTITKSVSNATTKTSAWTLSEDWNKTTSATNEHDEQIGKTQSKTDSEGHTTASKYYVSNSSGGASSHSSSGGGSSTSSSKVTEGTSTGINGSYTSENEQDRSVELHADVSLSGEAHVGNKVAGASMSSEVSGGVSTELANKDKQSSTIANSRNNSVGSESNDSNETHWESSSTSSSTWNSTKGYENSSSASKNTSVSNTISSVIYDRYAYSSMDSRGGSNSQTNSTGETQELTDEYASTLEYSVEEQTSVTKKITYTSNATGYYRLVTAGTVHVFAVVGYDIPTNSYFTYTYNVLDKERHEYLDYSKDNANFNDCENAILPFEIPYFVNEYIYSKIARSQGLTVDTDSGIVTEYNGNAEYVIIPEYVSVNNGDGTYSAVRIRGFDSDVFKGNTSIKGVSLPKYVYSIPDNAFEGCNSLETITGFGIQEIGNETFKDCTSLNSFSIDKYVTVLGLNAFENAPEISVSAANPDVAQAAIDSGAKKISLNFSDMEGSFDNRIVQVSNDTDYFALMSNGIYYNNLQVDSKAKETFISNIKFVHNTDTPLKLESEKVTLNRVTVENSPGFALIMTSLQTTLNLFGTIALTSQGENTVISRDVTLGKADPEVAGKLKLSGNYLVCGDVDNSKMLEFTNGEVIHINEDEFNSMLTSSIITFDANGGVLSETTKTVYYSQTYGNLPTPSYPNYNFDGWFTAKEGGTEITSNTAVSVLANQILYAHWTPKTFTVTFDANTGSVSTNSKTVTYGESFGILPVPTKDYYSFDGWFTDTEGSTEITSDTVTDSSDDVTLYAHWTQKAVIDWTKYESIPSGVQILATKWSYTLTEHKTSSSSTMSGWTKEKEPTWVWSSYGNWSGWQDGAVSGSDSRQVETRKVETSRTTWYHYYRYAQKREGGYGSPSYSSSYPNYYTYDFTSPLEEYQSGKYKWWYSSSNWVSLYAQGTYTTVDIQYKTQYRYRDRSKVYTYYFKRNVEKESTTQVTNGGDISNVQQWVQYREK